MDANERKYEKTVFCQNNGVGAITDFFEAVECESFINSNEFLTGKNACLRTG
jgi:hypothetical protein